jgi:hypothetical protein
MGTSEVALSETNENPTDTVIKSFFTKRIEKAIKDRVEVSDRVFALFDTPFDQFTPDCEELFERELVGKSVFWMFSEVLAKIYNEMNADRQGWEAAADFLKDTPIKYCALHAMEKVEKSKASSKIDNVDMDESSQLLVTPDDQKFGVRPYIERSRNGRRKRGDLRPCYA